MGDMNNRRQTLLETILKVYLHRDRYFSFYRQRNCGTIERTEMTDDICISSYLMDFYASESHFSSREMSVFLIVWLSSLTELLWKI
jgi:ADP-ribosylglycohydrolase